MKVSLECRIFQLLRLRWKLENGMTNADPEVVPAAIDWLNYEIAAMKKAIEG